MPFILIVKELRIVGAYQHVPAGFVPKSISTTPNPLSGLIKRVAQSEDTDAQLARRLATYFKGSELAKCGFLLKLSINDAVVEFDVGDDALEVFSEYLRGTLPSQRCPLLVFELISNLWKCDLRVTQFRHGTATKHTFGDNNGPHKLEVLQIENSLFVLVSTNVGDQTLNIFSHLQKGKKNRRTKSFNRQSCQRNQDYPGQKQNDLCSWRSDWRGVFFHL